LSLIGLAIEKQVQFADSCFVVFLEDGELVDAALDQSTEFEADRLELFLG
jgi:hypothetical protein